MRSISNVFRPFEIGNCYFDNILEVGLSDFVALDFLQSKISGDENQKKFSLVRIPNGTFYKFVEREKNNNEFQSIEISQIKFIEQFKVQYIFIQKNAIIPKLISDKIKILTSEHNKSGYTFYKII